MCLLNSLVFAEKVPLIWSILHLFLNCHIKIIVSFTISIQKIENCYVIRLVATSQNTVMRVELYMMQTHH